MRQGSAEGATRSQSITFDGAAGILRDAARRAQPLRMKKSLHPEQPERSVGVSKDEPRELEFADGPPTPAREEPIKKTARVCARAVSKFKGATRYSLRMMPSILRMCVKSVTKDP